MLAEDDTLVVCLKALIKARETIYAFHGEPAWELYQQSPEMTAINRAIEVATKVLGAHRAGVTSAIGGSDD